MVIEVERCNVKLHGQLHVIVGIGFYVESNDFAHLCIIYYDDYYYVHYMKRCYFILSFFHFVIEKGNEFIFLRVP